MTGTEIVKTEIDLNIPAVKVTGFGLEIGTMNKPTFEELGRRINTVDGAAQFWIGDWGNELQKQHGYGAVGELIEIIGLDHSTISHYMRVCKEFDNVARATFMEKGLTPAHLRASLAAPTPAFELENMPDDMTVKELRDQIKADNEVREAATLPTSKIKRFSWIKDTRIIETEAAFVTIKRTLDLLKTTNEDQAAAQILRGNFIKDLKRMGKRG